ncbi:hypothetical protein [Janthinobacterium sp.]|nr:hypothetical protein [Janthinobacterium sp.]
MMMFSCTNARHCTLPGGVLFQPANQYNYRSLGDGITVVRFAF